MKVLQILPELNSGGVERGTLEVADFLVKQGHEALVVSNGGRQVDALERSGARHIAMPVHRKSLGSLLLVRPFRKLLEKEKPDILHIRSRVPGWIAWLAWRKMDPATRPRLVRTVHGFYSVNRYSAVMTKGERVIAVSESIRDYILANYPGTDPRKITVIHRGVAPDEFPTGYEAPPEWRAEWGSQHPEVSGKCLLLLPGRITRWKGQVDFIRMVAGLKEKGMRVHGLIVGETHPNKMAFETELRNLAGELGVADDITFLGHRRDMKELVSIAGIVYSLSLDPEAFGRVSLEALSIGKPVIGYAHGGVAEQLGRIFPEGLVEPGDVFSAIDRSTRILEDFQQPGPIGDFTLERMLSLTMGVYAAVLSQATKRE